MSPDSTALTILAGISGFLTLIPLPWHLESWNIGTVLYMFWVSLGCFNIFIGGIVWRNDAILRAIPWCYFSARIVITLSWAIPFCSLCINRRLYSIAAIRSVSKSRGEKRQEAIVDFFIAFVCPMIGNVMHYISEGHRFNIIEEVGPYPYLFITPVAYLYLLPPLVVSLISSSYAIRSILALRRSYLQFKEFMGTNPNLNSSRYFRLMALAGADILISTPIQLYVVVLSSKQLLPWISFAETHEGYDRVDQFSALQWKNIPTLNTTFTVSRAFTIISALIFFAFFGLADEARKHYKSGFNSFLKCLGFSSSSTAGSTDSGSQSSGRNFAQRDASPAEFKPQSRDTPSYDSQSVDEKRDSIASSCDMTFINDSPKPTSGSPFSSLTKKETSEILQHRVSLARSGSSMYSSHTFYSFQNDSAELKFDDKNDTKV